MRKTLDQPTRKAPQPEGTVMPANRHKTGFRGPDPAVGKETQFRPGQSGNPSGRPRDPISRAYRELADQKVPGDPQGRTYAQKLAEEQFKAAFAGRTDAAHEITDRLEGKLAQRIEIDEFTRQLQERPTEDLLFRREHGCWPEERSEETKQ